MRILEIKSVNLKQNFTALVQEQNRNEGGISQ